MRYLVVDDEELSILFFRSVCNELERENKIDYFLEPFSAINFAIANPQIDVAFLDIEMPGMNGIELARTLKKLNPKILIVFVTGHDHYARQAFFIHADGFISKPFEWEEIRSELDYLESSKKTANVEPKVRIQCFGHFEVFVNRQPIVFTLKKAKELLAYLVDRNGSAVSTNQAIAILWEDDCNDIAAQNRFRKTVRDLRITLENHGIQEVFNNSRNSKSIKLGSFSCDYYDYLTGDAHARKKFVGEYMSGYSWGEETLAALVEKMNTM